MFCKLDSLKHSLVRRSVQESVIRGTKLIENIPEVDLAAIEIKLGILWVQLELVDNECAAVKRRTVLRAVRTMLTRGGSLCQTNKAGEPG